MSIVELVEKDPHAKSGVEFHFHDNYSRIEFITVHDENIQIQDKGADKKEAILNCCLKFYQRFDKYANHYEVGTDLFLLDDEYMSSVFSIKQTLGDRLKSYRNRPSSSSRGIPIR